MQLALSRIRLGMPLSLRQQAAASPEGPAPTITGPGKYVHLITFVGWPSWNGSWALFPSSSLK